MNDECLIDSFKEWQYVYMDIAMIYEQFIHWPVPIVTVISHKIYQSYTLYVAMKGYGVPCDCLTYNKDVKMCRLTVLSLERTWRRRGGHLVTSSMPEMKMI